MVKKISIMLISGAILVTGYIAFKKLNYWERSVRIFSVNNPSLSFGGRMGRGQGGFEGRRDYLQGDRTQGRAIRNLPDSIRQRSESPAGRIAVRNSNIPDSLRQQFRRTDRERIQGVVPDGRFRNGDGHGRGEFSGGKKVSLRNVLWFLLVFAAFTVITVYLDKTYYLIRKRFSRKL